MSTAVRLAGWAYFFVPTLCGGFYLSVDDCTIYIIGRGSTQAFLHAGVPGSGGLWGGRPKDGKRLGEATFARIAEFDMDERGSLLVSDRFANLIRLIEGDQVTTIAGNGSGIWRKDGPALQASFRLPHSIVAIGSKACISEAESCSIRILDRVSNSVSTIYPKIPGIATFLNSACLGYPRLYKIDHGFFNSKNQSEKSYRWTLCLVSTLGSLYAVDTATGHCQYLLEKCAAPSNALPGTFLAGAPEWKLDLAHFPKISENPSPASSWFTLPLKSWLGESSTPSIPSSTLIPLSNRVLPPSEGEIKRTPRKSPSFWSETIYAYSPISNSLIYWHREDYTTRLCSNFLKMRKYLGIPVFNLIDSSLVADIHIKHSISQQDLTIHSETFQLCLGLETLQRRLLLIETLEKTLFPLSSVRLFIMTVLYMNTDITDLGLFSTVDISNAIAICDLVGLKSSNLKNLMRNRLSQSDSAEQLVSDLINIITSSNIDTDLSTCGIEEVDFAVEKILSRIFDLSLQGRASKSSLEDIIKTLRLNGIGDTIINSLSSSKNSSNTELEPVSPLEMFPCVIEHIHTENAESFIKEIRNHRSDCSGKIPIYSSSSSTQRSSNSFLFGISEHPEHGYFIVQGWLLYLQWSWFRRLINSKLEESRSGVVLMPSELSPKALRSILQAAHSMQIGPLDLALEDWKSIIEFSEQFELPRPTINSSGVFDNLWHHIQALKPREYGDLKPFWEDTVKKEKKKMKF